MKTANKIIKSIEQQPKSKETLSNQLKILKTIADKLGMVDASAYIKRVTMGNK